MGRLESERGPLSANVTFVSHWGLYRSKAEQLQSPHWRASHRNATDIVLPVYLTLRKLQVRVAGEGRGATQEAVHGN